MKRLLPIAEDLATRLLRTRLDTPFCGQCGTEAAAVEELRKVVGNPSLALMFTPLAALIEREQEAADALKRVQLGFSSVEKPEGDLYAAAAKGLLQADYSKLEERVLAQCVEAKVVRHGLGYHMGGLVSPTGRTPEMARAALFAPYGGNSFSHAVVDELETTVIEAQGPDYRQEGEGIWLRKTFLADILKRTGAELGRPHMPKLVRLPEAAHEFAKTAAADLEQARATIKEMGELIDQQAAELKRLKENVNYMTEGCTCERAQGVPREQV